MKLKAYPKVNLCLKVFKHTTESKHTIDSVLFLYKKMHDTIIIKKAKSFSVKYFYRGKLFQMPNCLVTRTMQYLKEKHSIDTNYKIVIKKRIPIGGGLGGGSSDAAEIINYLIAGKEINLDLRDIALNLGSDIPFFLSRYKVARIRRFGEYVSPIYDFNPKIKLYVNYADISTGSVYTCLDKDWEYQSQVDVDRIIKAYVYKQHINVVYNDLSKYIIENNKQLAEEIKKYPQPSWFSGAGSTVVVLKD